MKSKICTKCKQNKPLSEYMANSRASGGLHWRCRPCTRGDKMASRAKEKVRQLAKYHANHAESLSKQRAYQAANRDKYRAASRKWREANPEEMKLSKWFWEQENPDRSAARSAKYYSRKRSRCPKWLSKEQKDHIILFYTTARHFTNETGIAHSVDHIIPLFGETVCGLHVPWNLQVLTAADNSRKQNYLDYEVSHVFRLA